jgi:hypothetical protein
LEQLPYSDDLAGRLHFMHPAGSIRKIIEITANRELRKDQGSYRADAVIFSLRAIGLDSFYRQRAQHERKGQPAETRDLFEVDRAVQHLIRHRHSEELAKIRAVPKETGYDVDELADAESARARVDTEEGEVEARTGAAWARLDNDNWIALATARRLAVTREEMIESPPEATAEAAEPKAPTRENRGTVAPRPWVYSFVDYLPAHRSIWLAYREGTRAPLRDRELSDLRQLELFRVWLDGEIARRESGILAEAARIREQLSTGERDRGAVLPDDLRDLALGEQLAPTVDGGIREWSLVLPESERENAKLAARSALHEIYESPVWIERAKGMPPGSYRASTKAERRAASLAAFEVQGTMRTVMSNFVRDMLEGSTDD